MREATTISISVTPKFKKKLDDTAKRLNIPRSVLLRKAVIDFIKTNPKKSDFTKDY